MLTCSSVKGYLFFSCLLYDWLPVGYEKFQFHERFPMMVNDFKDHKSVLCSRLIGTVCHVNLFERVRLVGVPMWTLFVVVTRMWLEGRVSAYAAGPLCVQYMCEGSWSCAEVWLLLWRVNSAKHYTYVKVLYAWSILADQVWSSCCWLFWLVFELASVATMMIFSWFSSDPSGEFRDLEMGHDPFIPYSHSSFINPSMRRFVTRATHIVFK
jgi:hypothetical protein